MVKLLTPPNSLRLLGAADSGSLQEAEDVPTTCDSARIGQSRSRHQKFAVFFCRMIFVFVLYYYYIGVMYTYSAAV